MQAKYKAIGTNHDLGRFFGLRKMCQCCNEMKAHKPEYRYPDWVLLKCVTCNSVTGKVPYNAKEYPKKTKHKSGSPKQPVSIAKLHRFIEAKTNEMLHGPREFRRFD